MVSPKNVARWQELKAKKLNGRIVPEDMEYKKLWMKHDANVLALNGLRWRAGLAEAIMISSVNNSSTRSMLDDVIQFEAGEEQEPYS